MRPQTLLLSLALAVTAVAVCLALTEVTTLPTDPHAPLSVPDGCFGCHATYLDELDPHAYVIPIDEMCLREGCHAPDRLGRSHPRGVDVSRSTVVEGVPEHIPLEEDRVSCGSCHQPHGSWLSTSQSYPMQAPELLLVGLRDGQEVETPYYRTYYLRVMGTAEDGFLALCNSCHPR